MPVASAIFASGVHGTLLSTPCCVSLSCIIQLHTPLRGLPKLLMTYASRWATSVPTSARCELWIAPAHTTNTADLVGRSVTVLFALARNLRSSTASAVHDASYVSEDFNFCAFLLAAPSHRCFRSLAAVSGQLTSAQLASVPTLVLHRSLDLILSISPVSHPVRTLRSSALRGIRVN